MSMTKKDGRGRMASHHPRDASHHQDLPRRQGPPGRHPRGRARRDPRDLRRERRRQVDADEGALGRLPARHLRRRRSSSTDEAVQFGSINDSEAKGIVIIHQELALSPVPVDRREHLPRQRAGQPRPHRLEQDQLRGRDAARPRRSATRTRSPRSCDIGVGKQQLVEIAKALSKEVKLLILDEPTAALNDDDSAHLLDLLRAPARARASPRSSSPTSSTRSTRSPTPSRSSATARPSRRST